MHLLDQLHQIIRIQAIRVDSKKIRFRRLRSEWLNRREDLLTLQQMIDTQTHTRSLAQWANTPDHRYEREDITALYEKRARLIAALEHTERALRSRREEVSSLEKAMTETMKELNQRQTRLDALRNKARQWTLLDWQR